MPYDKNRDHYDALAAYAKKEHDEDQRPAIKNAINLSDYDTVFIGYPMWWYTFPMIIYTLFDTVDFSGKTVVPFNTHMGSRDGGTYKTFREKARGATAGKRRSGFSHFAVLRGSFLRLRFGTASQVLQSGATEKGSILEKLVLFMPKNAKKTH